MPGVLEAKTVPEFDKSLSEAGGCLVVVHFWAEWAPQCQQINDILDELTKDTQHVNTTFIKVEAESLPEVSQRYEIVAVPTCVLLKNKSVVDRVNGANVPDLTKKVQQHCAATAGPLPTSKAPKEDLNTRLKKLINRAPVVLFMKGQPDEPRCGFSKTTVQLLNEQNVKFSHFDILSDEEVRQGLKTYSDWPTFPQLYINGELVGGLDIIKEIIESGEFKDMLPKTESLEDRLKKLTNRDQVMLFMKGNPDQPRCGFSKTIIGILGDTGISYGHFDILQDDEVRQGLKKFSNWPTYPQLYVKGELIGGLDIIKELKESGELESALKG